MTTNRLKYRPLLGRTSQLFRLGISRDTLWLAPDHLLTVRHTMFMERYRRFYFNEIQSLVICRTNRQTSLTVLFAMLLSVSALMFLSPAISNIVAEIVVGIVAGLFAAMLVFNVLLGPTCKFQIQTAVQTEPIPALGRVRKARKIRDALATLVEAAQGRLGEQAEQDGDGLYVEPVSPPTHSWDAKLTAIPRHENGKVHEVLFYLLLLWIPSLVFDLLFDNHMKNLGDLLLFLVTMSLMIPTFLKQRKSDLPVLIRHLMVFVFTFMVLMFIAGSLFTLLETGLRQEPANFFETRPSHHGPLLVFLLVFADVGQAVFGFIGLRWLYRFRRQALVAEHASEQPT